MKALFLGLMAVSLAIVVHGDDFLCCVPDQWEGKEYREGGDRETDGEFGSISYDATNERLAIAGTRYADGEQEEFKEILDFKNSLRYRINTKKQSCQTQALNVQFKKVCVRADATKVADSYVGAGSNKLNVTAYRSSANDGKLQTLIVIAGGCIPVSEDVWGETDTSDNYFASVNWVGLTAGIEKESVFSPPSYCPSSPPMSGQDFVERMFFRKHNVVKF